MLITKEIEIILCSANIEHYKDLGYELEKLKIRDYNYRYRIPRGTKLKVDKYGVENAFQSQEIKEKIKETNNKKFGCDNPGQSQEIRKKQVITWIKNMYNNGTSSSSLQQKYLCNLLKGELNYPVSNCMLDIAFPEDKIYIEVDFSGHDLRVRMGDITKEEFEKKERNREMFLNRCGWKRIRISSKKDYVPSDNKILELVNYAKEYLISGHSWIKFDIDASEVKCSQFVKMYDYGKLYKIKREQLRDIEEYKNHKAVM